MESFEDMLIRHEGTTHRMYLDSEGVPTIGTGHNLLRPISHAAVRQIFHDDVAEATQACRQAFPWFSELDEPRQWVLINMCFNLGLTRLQGFDQFLGAVERGDYDTAATEMLDSLWAKQVKKRAQELAALMRGRAVI